MAIPERFLEELNDRLNIVDVVSSYLPLSKKGGNHWGLCPFHQEKTPSFSVHEGKQMYHCFGCGKGGGMIGFVMEMEQLSFPDAVGLLAARAGLTVPDESGRDSGGQGRKKRLLELNQEAARFYRSVLAEPRGSAVAAYIQDKRHISPKYSARFGLGAAPDTWDSLIRAMADKGYEKEELLEAGLAVAGKNGGIYDKYRNRLMLPVIDVRGDIIGFTSRVMDDSVPKYLNTPETALFRKRSVLYGLNYARKTRRPNMILVEGNIDVITLHQAGFDNTIATMGTALTQEHINILSRYTEELVLCYDNDPAGEDATQRALALLRGSRLRVKVLRLPNLDGTSGKQDADDFVQGHGGAAFEELMNQSKNSVEYRLGQLEHQYDLTRDEHRTRYLQAAAGIIAGLGSPVEREIYSGRAAQRAGISQQAMLQEVERLRKKQAWAARNKEEQKALTPARNLQPQKRELHYQNLRSARAEEGILRIVMLDGEFFGQLNDIREDDFSSPLLGRVYGLLRKQWEAGRPVSLALLEGCLSREEFSHLSGIAQQPQPYHTAQAVLQDLKNIIHTEAEKNVPFGEEDLARFREIMRQRKGYGG